MPFQFEPGPLPGLQIITPRVFPDDRGAFFESYKRSDFIAAGITAEFRQDNNSVSIGEVVRGLHYQRRPHAQAKIIRVLVGAIWDVVVDVRHGSPTFGRAFGIELSAENRKMFYVPVGFAHGFATLSERVEINYKVTAEYCKAAEGGITWDDPALKIDWPLRNPILSAKDRVLPKLAEAPVDFVWGEE